EYSMRRDLVHRIANGELLAIGLQIAPHLSPGPELLPSFLFETVDGVDWHKSSVRKLGRAYERVSIVRAEENSSEVETPVQAKKKGRPAVGAVLDEIVRELGENGSLSNIPRKEQETRVRKYARQKHPNLFRTPSQPSRTTILAALKRQRF